jgi:maltose alpha-D-glucosyltransferase/alpha-amylase
MNIAPNIETAAAQDTDDDGLWFKDAIIYQLHVKAFQDSNNDGIGDFAGLTQRLDYLRDLGVNTLWLLPFYPSPGRDDGYDISDYGDINRQFGTMKDFRRFMQEAKRRGLRVITELVVNHTSDEHPWFKRARRSGRGTSAHNWYVWSDNDHKYSGTRIIFTDTEKSNWAWDDEAGAYYWHRFFSHQPDLNFDNPRVVKAVLQVMKRWLDTGVDGFRLDAVPYLCEREGTNNENLPETHAVIKTLRAELDAYAPGKVLLAEANQWPEDVQAYFGDGDECHMAYHFPLMPRIYMAIAQEDRFPITDIMRQTPEIPDNCQWAMFLRNHDELTLEMVTDSERDYLWSTYASDPRARINLGIRRRLAPLMDNDRRKIELMNSILMSMPGTPIMYYGDEIGMGDNIYLGDRNGVRTPMQWTPDRNGGFSRCDPAQLYLPCIMDPVYGYSALNVEAQARSLSSLLNWTKRLINVRKSTKVFGRGTLTFIRPENRAVLAYVRQLGEEAILCVANISRSAQAVELDMSQWKGRIPREMLGRTKFPRIGELPYLVTLPPYGYFWFSLEQETESVPENILPREVTTLVLGPGWESLRSGWTKRTLEMDVLPGFMPERRWFADKAYRPFTISVSAAIPIEHDGDHFVAAIADVTGGHGTSRYFLPLTIRWTRYTAVDKGPATVLAAVRRGPREGTLLDATAEPEFISALMAKIHAGETVSSDGQRMEFRATSAFALAPLPEIKTVNAVDREQSNSSVIVDGEYVVKILRRVTSGIHPEIEVGRFLVDVAHFQNAPALLGSIELLEGENRTALAVVHAYVENQGDAWSVTSASLDRFVEEQRLLPDEAMSETSETASTLQRMRQIGKRTAEMHLGFAGGAGIPAFAPEPITAADTARWTDALLARARNVFTLLERGLKNLSDPASTLAGRLLENCDAITAHIEQGRGETFDGMKIRHHGDFHLGQVLVAKDDAYILDFEGEPRRSLDERRSKEPAARDVAGFLRSMDYATSAALFRAPALNPEDYATLAKRIRTWGEQMTAAYWQSYRETLGDSPLWPAEDDQTRDLLNLFLLEKALYEIEYELSNRPSWAHIPIEATLRILEQRGVIRPEQSGENSL